MYKRKRMRQMFSKFFIMLLLVSSFLPHVAFANENENKVIDLQVKGEQFEKEREAEFYEQEVASTELEEGEFEHLLSAIGWDVPEINVEVDTQDKIEQAVYEALEEEKEVDVIVRLKGQADYNKIYADTKGKGKSTKAKEVVTSLQQNAKTSQQGIEKAIVSLEKKGKAKKKDTLWIINGITLTVSKDGLEELKNHKEIERITLDKEVPLPEITVEQSKPRLPEWGLEKIFAPKVWGDYGLKGEGIVVGIMDTGVDGNHEALRHNYRGRDGNHQYSWIDLSGNNYATPADGHGHGTHVAGTAVGGGEGEPIGVAPEAEWIAAKIFNDGGSTTISAIHQAFEWFMAPGGDPSKAPHVVNNSWGNANAYNTEFYEDVQAWVAAGIFPLFSAGNEGPGSQTVGSPGSFPESFAIGATDVNDQIASFSSRGPVYWTDEDGNQQRIIKPDVSAPGHQIYSAWPSVRGAGKYHTISGTSMAAPHVSGAIALIYQANPQLTIEEVKDILKRTARVESFMGNTPNDVYGHGIINVYQAVTEAAFAGNISGTIQSEESIEVPIKISIPTQNMEVTSNDGTFQFSVREGTHRVLVSAFGYDLLQTEVTVKKGETTEVQWVLQPSERYTVTGTVRETTSNEPVRFAYIRMKGTPLAAVRTNESGAFSVSNIPIGNYELIITGEGIKGHTEQVEITNNVELDLYVDEHNLSSNSNWSTANYSYERNAVSPNAIDIDGMQKQWTYSTSSKGQILFSTPAVTENTVVFTTDRGWITALNRSTGEEIWSVRLGATNRSTPTIADGKVFVSGGQDGTMYSLDLKTGRTIWSKSIGQPAVYESAIYKDGVLYIGSGLNDNPSFYALNADNGETLWRKELGGASYFGGTLGEGLIFIGTYDNRTLRALRVEDGSEAWSITLSNEGFASRPVYQEGTLYVTSANFSNGSGTLHALNAVNGEHVWQVGGIGDTQAGSPIVYEEFVIVNSSTQPIVRAFHRENGTELWSNRFVGFGVHNGSVSANGVLFFAGTSGTLYALDVYSGSILREMSLQDYSTSGIPIIPGNVIVPHRSGIESYVSNGTIEGTITDKSGNGTEAIITIAETNYRTQSSNEGAFSLQHEPGTYTLKVSSYGKKQIEDEVMIVSGYKETLNYELEDAEIGALQISVQDKRTGNRLPNVDIVIQDTGLQGVSNEQGELHVEEIFEGTYNVEFLINGYEKVLLPVTVAPNELAVMTVELSPFDIAVLNDWQGEVTALLNMNGFLAEEREWDIINDIYRYDVVYLNGAYGSGGWKPDATLFNQLIDVAKEHDVSLIFADAWGSNYGSIRQLTEYTQDPKEIAHYYGSGQVRLQADEEHPILEGMNKGERVTLYTRTGDFAWFNRYSGRHLASIGSTTQGMVGTGVAYKAVSENSAHLLLGSHAASPWVSPLQGWLADMQSILFNGVRYLQEVNFGEVSGSIVDLEGNPVEAEVRIVETNQQEKSDVEGEFQFYHDVGTFVLEIRSPGFATQREQVTIINGEPVELSIVLHHSNGDRLSGNVTDSITQLGIANAEVKLIQNEEIMVEQETTSNGRFEFTSLQYGQYKLRIEKEGYIIHSENIEVGRVQDELEIDLYPTPKVAVLGDYSNQSRNFQYTMSQAGIPVTPLSVQNVVEEVGHYDVIFINDISGSSYNKAIFENMMEKADEAKTSVIFGDVYFSGSGINHLVNYREDPQIRRNVAETTKAANYVLLEEHPIFKGIEVGEQVELLLPSGSRISYFDDYSGYPIAEISHEGKADSHGLGVAYKPRTDNSVELLMSGHGFGLYHYYDHYTEEGLQLLTNAVVWAAYAQFNVISGVITDEEANPLYASVEVDGVPFDTATDPSTGEFSIAIKDGDYDVTITSFGYDRKIEQIRLDNNFEPLEIEMVVSENVGSIAGTIEDEKDGSALEGVEVNIVGIPRESVTNSQGNFSISRLEPGDYILKMVKDGYVHKEMEVTIEESEQLNLSIELKPSPTIGVIVDATASSAVSMEDYLEGKGYNVVNMFYTDLELLQEIDLVIANSDYNNSLIPTKDEFSAFQLALNETNTSVIWTGQHGGRGAIRYLYEYENNPPVEIRGSKAGMKGAILENHPILEGVPTEFSMLAGSNYYYAFDGYDGTVIADVIHDTDGRVGSAIAYKGRTSESVEILLANFTFSSNFHPGNRQHFDENREAIFLNAINWALENEEALVGELYGSVKNQQERNVKATITVLETGKIVETDVEGNFYLGLPSGQYTLKVEAFGHVTDQFEVELENGETINRTFQLSTDRAGLVKGTVLHGQDETPIEGATITIMGTPITTMTDENGEYEVDVPVGTYSVRASATGHTSVVQANVVVEENESIVVPFLLQTSEKVAIVATSTYGDRIQQFLSDRGYDSEVIVNSNLSPLMDNLSEYAVIIFNDKHSNMSQAQFNEFLQATSENDVSIIFSSQFSGGTIRDLSDAVGNPANVTWAFVPSHVNVKVLHEHPIFAGFTEDEIQILNNGTSSQQYAVYSGYSGTTIGSISHDERGGLGEGIGFEFASANSVHILLSGMRVGSYGQPETRWTEEGKQLYTNAIDWAISASLGEIVGTVTTEDGEPISNATIVIEALGYETKTNAQGQYRLGVGSGTYEVKALARGYEEKTETVVVENLGESVEANFTLTKLDGMTITGTVINNRTEESITEAKVTLTEVSSSILLEELTTNEDGYFEFADLLEGEYEITAHMDGYISVSTVVVVEEEDITITLAMNAIEVAVIGDWNNNLLNFLNSEEVYAEGQDWNVSDNLGNYELVIVNSNKGTKEELERLIDAAALHEVSIVFVGSWAGEGSISLLEKAFSTPILDKHGYNEGAVLLKLNEQHPIFEGLTDDDGYIEIHANQSPYATYQDLPGKVISNINVDGDDKGASVAYEFKGTNHMHLYLSSFAVTNIIGPDYGWTEKGKQLFIQSLQFARDAEIEDEQPTPTIPAAPTWDESRIQTNESTVTITGKGEVGSIVHIYEEKGKKRTLLESVEVLEDGTFSYTDQYGNGNHFLYAQAENEVGLSEWSEKLQLIITGKPR
ncbi:carboxypeptidase regulatory-like domain-containing protein [Sutcliffiella cohnii]